MARDLSALQKQYNSSASAQRRGPGGPGGPRGRMGGMGGKRSLKNARKTITRILGYLARYKLRIFVVLLCMLANTLASLCCSYLLAPIINKLTLAVTGEEQPMSNIERLADNIISRFTGADRKSVV